MPDAATNKMLLMPYSGCRAQHGAHVLQEIECSQVADLSFRLQEVKEEEPSKVRVSRRQEILKIRTDANAMEDRDKIEKIRETKTVFSRSVTLVKL